MLVGLWGCADKFTHENFSRIRPQVSTQTEVVELIGEPTNRIGSQWLYDRTDRHLNALVDFDPSGRVTRTQWIDAESGEWQDSERPVPAKRTEERTTIETRKP